MAAMIACNNTEIIDVGGKLTNAITFDNVNTRAGLSDLEDNGFGVWACVSSKDAGSSVQYEPLLDNERVYLKDGEWTYDNTQLWISNSMFYFFAAYPKEIGVQQQRLEYDEDVVVIYSLDITADGSNNTEDILVATNVTDTTAESFDPDNVVPLTFGHLLTKINFKIRQNFDIDPDFNYYVTRVIITGVKGNAKYSCDPYDDSFYSEWDYDNSADITIEKVYSEPVLLRNIGAENPVVTLSVWGNNGLMLVPQEINGNAKIKVEYYYDVNSDDDSYGTATYVEGFIPATRWESGQSISYTLSIANQNNISFSQPSIGPWGSPQTGGTIIIQ